MFTLDEAQLPWLDNGIGGRAFAIQSKLYNPKASSWLTWWFACTNEYFTFPVLSVERATLNLEVHCRLLEISHVGGRIIYYSNFQNTMQSMAQTMYVQKFQSIWNKANIIFPEK